MCSIGIDYSMILTKDISHLFIHGAGAMLASTFNWICTNQTILRGERMAKGKEKNAEKEGEGTWGKGRGARGQREEGGEGEKESWGVWNIYFRGLWFVWWWSLKGLRQYKRAVPKMSRIIVWTAEQFTSKVAPCKVSVLFDVLHWFWHNLRTVCSLSLWHGELTWATKVICEVCESTTAFFPS